MQINSLRLGGRALVIIIIADRDCGLDIYMIDDATTLHLIVMIYLLPLTISSKCYVQQGATSEQQRESRH